MIVALFFLAQIFEENWWEDCAQTVCTHAFDAFVTVLAPAFAVHIIRCFLIDTLQRKSTLFQMEGLHTSPPSILHCQERTDQDIWLSCDPWQTGRVEPTQMWRKRPNVWKELGKNWGHSSKKGTYTDTSQSDVEEKELDFCRLSFFFSRFWYGWWAWVHRRFWCPSPPKKTRTMNSTPWGRGFMNFKQKLCRCGGIMNHHEFSIKVLFDLLFVVVGGEGDRLSLTIKPWMGRFSDQTAIVSLALIQV